MRFSRLPLAALAALAATLVPFAAIPAHAQKPALTQNIDEKGRVPYHSDSSCTVGLVSACTMVFRPVPAGYRLVVTHASAQFVGEPPLQNALGACGILQGGTPAPGETGYQLVLAAVNTGNVIGGTYPNFVVSSPVTYYVEPLGQPLMQIFDILNVPDGGAVGSISGYLVAIN